MKAKWLGWGLVGILAVSAFVALGGEVVLHLWNWLLPSLFGVRPITFWEAIGVLALSRILFGAWGVHGHGRSKFRRKMGERWESMTPEEREKFRQGMRGRCGGFGETAETKG